MAIDHATLDGPHTHTHTQDIARPEPPGCATHTHAHTHTQDIFKPEPPRLRRHLSAIINFAKFREEKALAFQELQVRARTCV